MLLHLLHRSVTTTGWEVCCFTPAVNTFSAWQTTRRYECGTLKINATPKLWKRISTLSRR